jgi:hypothetical protein
MTIWEFAVLWLDFISYTVISCFEDKNSKRNGYSYGNKVVGGDVKSMCNDK